MMPHVMPGSTTAASSGAAPEAAAPERGRAWPWKVCVFLLFATMLSYLDRQALSVVAPTVKAELGLDNEKLGRLLSAFFAAYAVMHLVVGPILDRGSPRFVYGAFVGLWSIAQMLGGLAQGFVSLFCARLLLGACEAAGQPGAARIIARIVPARDRSLANGIMMSGGSMGAMIAGPLVIGMSSVVGWRMAFVALGACGLVWALGWVLWFRPPAAMALSVSGPSAALPARQREPWGQILRLPRFWACVVGAAFAIPIIHVMGSWVPTYLSQTWKVPLGAGMATYLFLIYLGLDLGFLTGGAVTSLLVRRGVPVPRARKMVMAGSTALILLAAAVPRAPSVPVAVALVALVNAGRAAWGATFLAFNQEIAPGRVGTMAGFMGFVGAASGTFLIWAIGAISKNRGFGPPFLLVAVLGLAGLVPILLTRWEEPGSHLRG